MSVWVQSVLSARSLAILVAAAVVVAVAAVLAWSELDTEAQPSEPVLTRWGNITVLAPSRDSDVVVDRRMFDGDLVLYLSPRTSDEHVLVDASDGSILYDDVAGDARAAVDEVLASISVEQAPLSVAVWPYVDSPPPALANVGGALIPWPDAASGIAVILETSDPGGEYVHYDNGRSVLVIDLGTGLVVGEATSVDPVDEVAFDRLLEEVQRSI